LPGPHRQVADDAVALVEKPDHRDALPHRGHALLCCGGRRRRLVPAALLLGRLVAAAANGGDRQGCNDRWLGAHYCSGTQGS
jgi:hypothetical protein